LTLRHVAGHISGPGTIWLIALAAPLPLAALTSADSRKAALDATSADSGRFAEA
jgi:hypothetical protein